MPTYIPVSCVTIEKIRNLRILFPFLDDKNRVILDIDTEGSDYINASFIDVSLSWGVKLFFTNVILFLGHP